MRRYILAFALITSSVFAIEINKDNCSQYVQKQKECAIRLVKEKGMDADKAFQVCWESWVKELCQDKGHSCIMQYTVGLGQYCAADLMQAKLEVRKFEVR